nr:hypothetical protein Itr_chr06CG22980 [Ipomoea trifida]
MSLQQVNVSKLLLLLLLGFGLFGRLANGGRMTAALPPENRRRSPYGTMLPKGELVPPSGPSPNHNHPIGNSAPPRFGPM